VVFVNYGNLWLWEEGKSSVQLTQSGHIGQVTISDDGQVIAFTRELDENHAELWAINPDGSNERRLVSADELTQMDGSKDALGVLLADLQWEPGTHHLIFNTYPVYHALWVYEPQIYWLVNVDTGEISLAPYSGGYIAYSPDGTQMVIYDMAELSLVHTDGSDLKEDILDPYHGIGLGEQFYNPWPYWASDSTSLLVALPDQEDMYNDNATITVWRVPVVGTPEMLGSWRAFAPSVSFSPDQNYMAYWISQKGGANQRELHLVQINGRTSNTPLDIIYTSGDMIDIVAWSPDSQHFIFKMGNAQQQSQFFYIGDICQQPFKLAENAGGDYLMVSGEVATWVDTSRYLLEVGIPIYYVKWELHLGIIGSEQTDVLGEVTAYDWAILP
jgi:dipeptidyl aminopeptidase/acylaminoacyl peptidase